MYLNWYVGHQTSSPPTLDAHVPPILSARVLGVGCRHACLVANVPMRFNQLPVVGFAALIFGAKARRGGVRREELHGVVWGGVVRVDGEDWR